jgi:adenylate cyclase
MLGQLVPCGGGPPIALLKPRLLVGRHNYCDIPLHFGSVSGRHCELEFVDGYWLVRDLGSSNGTRVNNIICSAQRLMPNDVLSVAKYRYTIVYKAPAAGTPVRGAATPAGWAEAARPGSTVQLKRPQPPARPRSPGASAEAALGQLVPCGGGDPIPLHKPQLMVGRSPSCDIVLSIGTVSGQHCRLEWADGQWSVRDLGSRNGVRVDGTRCEEKVLPPGCVLAIANLRFQVVYKGADAKPAREPSLFAQSLLAKIGLLGGPPQAPGEPQDSEQDEDMRKRYRLDEAE